MENAREDVRRLVDESGNFSSSENWKTFGQLVARPTANKTAASHDELLKDEKHYGILQWGGGHIVVRTDGRREILSRDNVQAFTGASTEHMCEHLNSIGLWAEVYKPRGEAPRVSDTPTKTPPPSPENNSPDAWLPKTYDEVVELLQFRNPQLDHDQVCRRVRQFEKHTGEFRDEEKRQRFLERLRHLRVKKIAEDEKQIALDRERMRRRERKRRKVEQDRANAHKEYLATLERQKLKHENTRRRKSK
jgi:hypothetical protein